MAIIIFFIIIKKKKMIKASVLKDKEKLEPSHIDGKQLGNSSKSET